MHFRVSALVTFNLSFILEMSVCFLFLVLIQKALSGGRRGGGRDLPSSCIQWIFDSLLDACHCAFYGNPCLEFLCIFPFLHGNLIYPVSCSSYIASFLKCPLLYELFTLSSSLTAFCLSYICGIVYVSVWLSRETKHLPCRARPSLRPFLFTPEHYPFHLTHRSRSANVCWMGNSYRDERLLVTCSEVWKWEYCPWLWVGD